MLRIHIQPCCIDSVWVIAEQILDKGYVARPYLGVRWQSINPRISRIFDLPVDWGVYISDVFPSSPASMSGISEGDIVTQIGDTAIDEENTYINTLFTYEPGQEISITIIRGAQQINIDVVLGEARANR